MSRSLLPLGPAPLFCFCFICFVPVLFPWPPCASYHPDTIYPFNIDMDLTEGSSLGLRIICIQNDAGWFRSLRESRGVWLKALSLFAQPGRTTVTRAQNLGSILKLEATDYWLRLAFLPACQLPGQTSGFPLLRLRCALRCQERQCLTHLVVCCLGS